MDKNLTKPFQRLETDSEREMLNGLDDIPTPELAKHDKVTVKVSQWIIEAATEEAFESFVNHLCCFPRATTAEIVYCVGEEDHLGESYGWIFNSASNPNQGNLTRLAVRKSSSVSRGHQCGFPLFGGFAEIRKGRTEQDGSCRGYISLTLHLNPTRFARYRGAAETLEIPQDLMIPKMRVRERESSLDGRDNYLTASQYESFSVPHFWRSLFTRYWQEVLIGIEGEFIRAADVAGVPTGEFSEPAGMTVSRDFNQKAFSIQTVETYWEMRSVDAMAELARFRPLLLAFGREIQNSHYPTMIEGRERNCMVLNLKIQDGVNLRVYAKTRQRIRFEVIHNLNKYGVRGGKVSRRPAKLLQVCWRLLEHAASKVSQILPRLIREPSESDSVTLLGFLEILNSAVSSPSQATNILQLLAYNRVIDCGTNSTLRNPVRTLMNRGILQASPQRGGPVCLSPPYHDLFDELFPLE